MANIPRNRLTEFRNRSRLTLEEVGTLTGYSVSAISRHENGSRPLTEEAIIKYSKLYKVHSYELFVDPAAVVCDGDSR